MRKTTSWKHCQKALGEREREKKVSEEVGWGVTLCCVPGFLWSLPPLKEHAAHILLAREPRGRADLVRSSTHAASAAGSYLLVVSFSLALRRYCRSQRLPATSAHDEERWVIAIFVVSAHLLHSFVSDRFVFGSATIRPRSSRVFYVARTNMLVKSPAFIRKKNWTLDFMTAKLRRTRTGNILVIGVFNRCCICEKESGFNQYECFSLCILKLYNVRMLPLILSDNVRWRLRRAMKRTVAASL